MRLTENSRFRRAPAPRRRIRREPDLQGNTNQWARIRPIGHRRILGRTLGPQRRVPPPCNRRFWRLQGRFPVLRTSVLLRAHLGKAGAPYVPLETCQRPGCRALARRRMPSQHGKLPAGGIRGPFGTAKTKHIAVARGRDRHHHRVRISPDNPHAHVSATRVLYPAPVKVSAASEKATRAPAIFWVQMRASGGQ